jgi:pimeloyl-ACP methyl ester carboxylesterase
MGAMVAYQLGVRFPELVRALVLEDPPWWLQERMTMRPVDQHAEHPMAPWVRTCTTSTLEELMAEARDEDPTWPEIVVQTWCAAKKRMDPNILSIVRIDGSNWQESIASLACPTLVFTADPELGGIVTPELAARACELNPRITIAHIPGVGHHIRFADYETYMQTFRKFLDTIHIGLG